MRLDSIYARFYRSLNYDFVRASDDRYAPDPWDSTPEGDYPFVRIRLRPEITTIVGANESGKSQVLNAIEAGLTGNGFAQSDFCRYSKFFGSRDEIVQPEFGVVFADIDAQAVSVIERSTNRTDLAGVDRIAIFRLNGKATASIYIRNHGAWSNPGVLENEEALAQMLAPVPFRIKAGIPLPDSVPINFLVTGRPVAPLNHNVLTAIWNSFTENSSWFDTDQTVVSNAGIISQMFRSTQQLTDKETAMYQLAADLIFKVAGIGREQIRQLQQHVRQKDAYANSIVDTINSELARALDFPNWWSQDSQFALFVSLYEFDLVFMIRDRTGRTYSFDERSEGLKFFLSYFVQYLAHENRADGRPEVLLMDEPDQFLSASGQQDLLRVFKDFAQPRDPNRRAVQVVYVTHSPFLIDKNEADRIRVLEKGENDEGTRVVGSAAANHYEPLRSAFGSFVAETTFIGNCNLMVEGTSDQVILAGASRWLKSRGVADRDRLDLNKVTIVPASGTRHIPYLVYLARGRDVEKPPVVVLLDNDSAGDEAREALAAGGAYGKTLLSNDLVLQLGQGSLSDLQSDNPMGVSGIEDLIPVRIAIQAASRYCREFVPSIDIDALEIKSAQIYPQPGSVASTQRNRGTLAYLQDAIADASASPTFHLDKVAFARAIVDLLLNASDAGNSLESEFNKFAQNIAAVLREIGVSQRRAERAEAVSRISSRINRAKRDFTRTHRDGARREEVVDLLEEIESQLNTSREAEEVRSIMRSWTEAFALGSDQREPIDDFKGFLKALDGLAYKAVRDSEIPPYV